MSEYTIPVNVYDFLQKGWVERCLKEDKSLLFDVEGVWTKENLGLVQSEILGNTMTSLEDSEIKDGDIFLSKLRKQFPQAKNSTIWLLICDLMALHYCFDSKTSSGRKAERIKKVLYKYIENSSQDNKESFEKKIDQFSKIKGRAWCGQYYNSHIWLGIGYYAWIASSYKGNSKAFKEAITNLTADEPSEIWDVLETLGNEAFFEDIKGNYEKAELKNRFIPHIFAMLHMLAPKYFIDIVSLGHKQKIIDTFQSFLEDAKGNSESNKEICSDKIIYRISEKLKEIEDITARDDNGFADGFVNFYDEKIRMLWDDGLTGGDLGIVKALEIKKQVVLYGPPGTGKTHTAKNVAKTLLFNLEISSSHNKRSESIKNLLTEGQGFSKQIDIVQFHPSFSYEDFVGCQTLINIDGVQQVQYKKGVFWNIIDKAKQDESKSFVLILDEINRADLSRLMGECLNVLEYRDEENAISVPNTDEKFYIPSNLYIIGTMNEIDHSLERIDFAMRRRFIWIEVNYDADALAQILKDKKDEKNTIDQDQLETLISSANNLNKYIGDTFGNAYKIGHCYFAQIVKYMKKNTKTEFEKAKSILWQYHIKPLIEQYSMDASHQKTIQEAEKTFNNGK